MPLAIFFAVEGSSSVEIEPLWHCNGMTGSGGEGNRTPGLFDATEALYQLSYTPDGKSGRIYLCGLAADPSAPCAPRSTSPLVRSPAQSYWFAVRRIIITADGPVLAWGK